MSTLVLEKPRKDAYTHYMSQKLIQGAKAAITQCLNVTAQDRVVIVTDKKTQEVASALQAEVQKITPNVKTLIIEDYVQRPAKELSQKLVDDITIFKPTVSIYAAEGQPGELSVFRRPLVDDVLYNGLGCRHAHMINITKQLMEDGMNKDYDLVYKITNRVCALAQKADKLIATDPYGTNITFNLDSANLKWIPSHGKILPGAHWQNLPSGETFTCPKSASGVFVAWILGDDLSEKYGELKTPLVVTIKDGYITNVSLPADAHDSKTEDAKKDFEKYITEYPMGNRVGELGVGTLVGLTHFVGNLLQDEKFPGVHIAFGHPYSHETGANWDCESHIDIIAKSVTIKLVTGGVERVIMQGGKYVDGI